MLLCSLKLPNLSSDLINQSMFISVKCRSHSDQLWHWIIWELQYTQVNVWAEVEPHLAGIPNHDEVPREGRYWLVRRQLRLLYSIIWIWWTYTRKKPACAFVQAYFNMSYSGWTTWRGSYPMPAVRVLHHRAGPCHPHPVQPHDIQGVCTAGGGNRV